MEFAGREGEQFGRLAAKANAPLDRLLLAVSAELGEPPAGSPLEQLDELSRPLFGVAELGAVAFTRALVRTLVEDAGFRPGGSGIDALLLDRVVDSRRGHPVILAAVFAEVARRTGVRLVPVAGAGEWHVGLVDRHELVLVSVARVDRCRRGVEGLRCYCPHELTCVVLAELARGLEAGDDRVRARHAARLQGLLPVGGPP